MRPPLLRGQQQRQVLPMRELRLLLGLQLPVRLNLQLQLPVLLLVLLVGLVLLVLLVLRQNRRPPKRSRLVQTGLLRHQLGRHASKTSYD